MYTVIRRIVLACGLLVFAAAMILPLVVVAQTPGFCGNFTLPCWTTAGRPANPGAGTFGYNRTMSVLEVWNGTAWREAMGPGGTVNIQDFGACMGSGNDAPFINSAVQVIRALGFGRLTGPESGCQSTFTSTLNFTDLDAAAFVTPSPLLPSNTVFNIIIDIGGVLLDCQVTGGICVDNLNSKGLTWLSFNMISHAVNEPAIGFQYGSPCWGQAIDPNCPGTAVQQITASQNTFYNMQINGWFTLAAKINMSSEGSGEYKGAYRNSDNAGFGYIIDCINHFAKASTFTTVFQTGTDLNTGCQGPGFYDTVVQQVGAAPVATASAIWVGGVGKVTFDEQSYASTNTTGTAPVITVYGNSSTANAYLDFRGHYENVNMPVTFMFTGTQSSYVINGLTRKDTGSQARFSDFGLDFAAGVQSVQINNLDYRLQGLSNNPATFTVFGNYNRLTAATVNTGGNGCTNSTYTFTVNGGTGNAATVTGTVAAGSLAGTLTVHSAGVYQATPGATPSLSGAGCAVAPTINATYTASSNPPITASGYLYVNNSTTLGRTPNNFGGVLCTELACNYAVSPFANLGAGVIPFSAQMFGGNQSLVFSTNGSTAGGVGAGGTWSFGSIAAAGVTNNGVGIPQMQSRAAAGSTNAQRAGFSAIGFSTTNNIGSSIVGAKSHTLTPDAQVAVSANEVVHTFSAQGSDGNQFQPSTELSYSVDNRSSVAGANSFTIGAASVVSGGNGYAVGDVVTWPDPTVLCAAPVTFSVTSITGNAANGPVSTVAVINGGGPCTAALATTASPTGGTGAGLSLAGAFSANPTPGLVPGRVTIGTAGSTYSAILAGTTVTPGWAGDGSCAASATFAATVTGGVCSVPPVYSVSTNAGGLITTINSVTTAGACTTVPPNPAPITGSTCGVGTSRIDAQYTNITPSVTIVSSQITSFLGLAQVKTAITADIIGKCNANTAGALVMVTDATSPTYNNALVGGAGAVQALSMCNGTIWVTP